MDVYRTEEEQVAAIRGWWLHNRKVILIAITLALASYGGWKWYQYTQQQADLEAAGLYQNMMTSLQEIAAGGPAATDAEVRFLKAGQTLVADHGDGPYGRYGALLMGGYAAEQDDYAGAEKHLRTALAIDGNAAVSATIEHRLARVLAAQGKYDDALAQLDGTPPEALVATRAEVRGDILLTQGKRGDARKAYQAAFDATKETDSARALLQMKLDYLAGE